MSENEVTIKKNSIYNVAIDGWSSDGSGVAHIDGLAVFIPKTIKGEYWRIKIVKVTKSAVYGIPIQLLISSPDRVTPECPIYGRCGGCQTAHISYARELSMKLENVNNTIKHVGNLDISITDIIPSEKEFFYRNKSICAVGLDSLNRTVFGFYQKRSHNIIPMESCILQSTESNLVNRVIVDWMNDEHILPYNETTFNGTIRHIFSRKAEHTQDFVVCIITAKGFGKKTDSLISVLLEKCPFITGIVLNVNKEKGNTILAGDFYTLYGNPNVEDFLNHIRFNISPQAFFQVNPLQAEKLYNKIKQYADLSGKETILDLYCGTGTIALSLAEHAKVVIGIEIVKEAIENAIENAKLNGITNVQFYCEDASVFANRVSEHMISPDIIIVDPPRKGLSVTVIDAIDLLKPSKLIYVSCNPATLSRDLNLLANKNYKYVSGCAFDMFPKTSHVETVCLLTHS